MGLCQAASYQRIQGLELRWQGASELWWQNRDMGKDIVLKRDRHFGSSPWCPFGSIFQKSSKKNMSRDRPESCENQREKLVTKRLLSKLQRSPKSGVIIYRWLCVLHAGWTPVGLEKTWWWLTIYHILLSAVNGLRLLTTDGSGECFGERDQEKLHDTEYITWEGGY